ncbi:MAG: JAB domain-containing protein [Myxococcota bacterium]
MSLTHMDRAACFRVLFADNRAKRIADASWGELLAACVDPKHERVRDWPEWEVQRLRALVRLMQLYYPSRWYEPAHVAEVGDVVARFTARCEALTERTMWLVVLDGSGCVKDEVLVLMGGSTTALPPLKKLLRLAILKDAEAVYVVDFRPLDVLTVDAGLEHALASLRQLGELAGVVVHDWVLVGPAGVVALERDARALRKAA